MKLTAMTIKIMKIILLEASSHFSSKYFQFMDVFRPTAEWGPGDKSQKKLWLEKKRSRQMMQGYDNPTMAYPYYNYGYGNYGHHGHM